MPTARTDDFGRALAFERRSFELIAKRVERLPYGFAYLDDSLPLVYYAKTLWVTAARVAGERLLADADRLLGQRAHRWVIVEDESLPDAVADAFATAGWEVRRFAYMAYRGVRAQPATADVREVSREEMLEAEDRYLRAQPWGGDPEQRRQLVEHHRRIGRAGNERYFAAFAGGEVAGYAKLRHRDAIAQVEDVVVREQYRGRGLGRLVTATAVQAGVELEPDLLFIVAWDDDWPQQLYAKLGFEHIGRPRLFRAAGSP